MQLKHIFSNINIANLLLKIKKYFNDEHFDNISETILKFQACSLEKCFALYECPICKATHKFKVTCKSRLCPSCGKKYSAIWAEKTVIPLLMLNIERFFLLYLKRLENFSFMIEIF